MRYNDFKLTEDELFEVKMSPNRISAAIANLPARAGFEFEMIIPLDDFEFDDDHEEEPDIEPDYDYDRRFPLNAQTWETQITDFFMGGDEPNDRSDVERSLYAFKQSYLEWEKEKWETATSVRQADHNEFIVTLKHKFPNKNPLEIIRDKGEDYQAGLKAFCEEKRGNPTYREFLETYNLSSMLRFMRYVRDDLGANLNWPYVYMPEREYDSDGRDRKLASLAAEFGVVLTTNVNYSWDHHGSERVNGEWNLEGDGSLKGRGQGVGLELITPPDGLPLSDMIKDLHKVFTWAKRNNVKTGAEHETGLHINVSIEGLEDEDIDYVKLILFLGDHHILNMFERYGNGYCKSAFDQLLSKSNTSIRSMFQNIQYNLSASASRNVHHGSADKFTSVHPKEGYIEFRGPGGDWLNHDVDKIIGVLNRMVYAIHLASNPELYRKEYLTKLGKLLPSGNQAENTLSQLFKDYMTGKLSIREVEELWTSYVNNNKRVRLPLPGATDYSVWGQKSVPQSPKTLAHANRIEVRRQIRRLATTPLNTADLQNLANGNLESTVGISPADNLQYMSQDELNQVMSNARQTLASREQQ